MNWIKNFVRPRIRSILGVVRREVPENMWIKDPDSGQMVFFKDLEANQFVFPGSDHHHRVPVATRFSLMFDGGVFEPLPAPTATIDPLKFRAEKKYTDQLKDAKAKAAAEDSVQAGFGTVNDQPMVIAVQDMGFIGGSLGMVDIVVHRHDMKATVSRIARLLMKQDAKVMTGALVPVE